MAAKMVFVFAVLLLGTKLIPSSVGIRVTVVALPAETTMIVPAAEKLTFGAAFKEAEAKHSEISTTSAAAGSQGVEA
ncbi:hypothetical protein EJB05_15672 [Eragrostis curvula]|uniref:Uncharacterized protein n=1 Tax=Eragrostis curvula TaxID=38414 RepID=A0A5J9VCL2_9POAL|nr:hypothetical protein EJB05_15672 [Eragrostis curvula]